MIGSEDAAKAFCRERIDDRAMNRLEQFVAFLGQEAERQNLIATSSLTKIWQRHVADSVQLLDHVSRETLAWLDLGTGAGFPGLIIAIARPSFAVTLVESRRKRAEWLTRMVEQLDMAQCTVFPQRLERVDSFPADVISARAFAPISRLIDLSTRFSTSETLWLLPKGRSAWEELAKLDPPRRAVFHVKQSLTGPESGIIVGRGRPPDP